MRYKYISFLIDLNTWIIKNSALSDGIQLVDKLYKDYFNLSTR